MNRVHFTDGDTEAPRHNVTSPWPHGWSEHLHGLHRAAMLTLSLTLDTAANFLAMEIIK